jgi:hypothetical protein
MSKILGSHVPMEEAINSLISHFYDIFDFPKISFSTSFLATSFSEWNHASLLDKTRNF